MDRLKNIKLIIFDFDGTIYHLGINWGSIRKSLGVSNDESLGDLIQTYVENNNAEKLSIITNAELEDVGDRTLHSDVVDVLCRLYDKEIRLAVFTRNSRMAVEKALRDTAIEGKVRIVGREDVVAQKPNPEGIYKLMEQEGVSADETVLVGDTYHDVKSANSASIRAIIVKNDQLEFRPEGADEYIDSLKDLTN